MNEDPYECEVPGCPWPRGAGLRACANHADPRVPPRFDFGWALDTLKLGKRVARRGWNGKGMWLALWREGTYDGGSELFENCKPARLYAASCASQGVDVAPTIVMKTAGGSLLFGWLASQADMLAEDWELVELSE